MAGVTSTGFEALRLSDILDAKLVALAAVTDPETGETLELDFDADDGPLVQIEQIDADAEALVWEMMQITYNQFDPAKSSGAALRGLVQLNGLSARLGTVSTTTLTLVGTPGVELPSGQRVGSSSNSSVIFQTTAAATFDGSGDATVAAQCETVGPVAAPAGDLTIILTPQGGWTSATNETDASLGAAPELDPALRARRDKSTAAPSVGPVEATQANLAQLEGVTFARVYINNLSTTDARGVPAKSMAAVVVGGDDTEIARVLYLRNAGGVFFHGNTSETLYDNQGEPYPINWTRPPAVDVWVEMDITITDPRAFPATGIADIKAAIVAYAQLGRAGLQIDVGFEEMGFAPGQDISKSRLYTPANSVPGFTISRLQIGTAEGVVGDADIVIGFDEVGAFDSTRIEVSEV